jgi:hypothetical protein
MRMGLFDDGGRLRRIESSSAAGRMLADLTVRA